MSGDRILAKHEPHVGAIDALDLEPAAARGQQQAAAERISVENVRRGAVRMLEIVERFASN